MNVALILSGGTGARLGSDIPKQYLKVNNRCILSYCLESIFRHPEVDAVQIVAAISWQQEILDEIKELQIPGSEKFRGFTAPGKTRQLSILNGLEDILTYASETDGVLIHDAARPCLSENMITECFAGLKSAEGVLPVLPMKDTVYFSGEGKTIDSLLNRSQIYAGQAPEAFLLGKYYEANKALLPEEILKINGSTEPAILAEMKVAMIPGDEGNFKITTKADLERFEQIINKQ
jgi:2-C-methyl-D-erythritol 4-phosphate cytidylyltransferase